MIEIIKLDRPNPESSQKLQRILSRTNGLNGEVLAQAETVVARC